MVIKIDLTYNIVLERPLLYKINILISTKFLVMKFSMNKRMNNIERNQLMLIKCNITCLKGKKYIMDRVDTIS
jgi:hypothetical protein